MNRGLDALIFPTIRSPAPMRGDDAQPSNGELGASTGMPSIVVPSDWTDDTLPMPLSRECFGRAWDEQQLISLAYE
ncbi:MAG: amidase [Devosia sp.]|uniref:hypothetical protein n=1 Tax=Devosia sp. TaxID=1871048 RepID=UPI0026210ACA|nr:hypothetical protein [Devosia sp.]MDB5530715.1 amidase [Devosia sp.]